MKNNTNMVDRIKLMMSYDSEKTLNENLNVLNLLNEDESIEVDEQRTAISKELKNLGLGAKETAVISAMGKEFGIADNIIATALTKDLTQLTKELEDAIKKDLKNSTVGISKTQSLGPLAKQASKLKAMKEMAQKSAELKQVGRQLSTNEITNIIERTKKEAKSMALKIESNSITKAGKRKPPKVKDGEIVPTNVKNSQEAANELSAAQKSAEVVPEAKEIAKEGEKLAKENPKKWSLFNDIKEKLKKKYWYYLCGLHKILLPKKLYCN
jgi:hypothetical protein